MMSKVAAWIVSAIISVIAGALFILLNLTLGGHY